METRPGSRNGAVTIQVRPRACQLKRRRLEEEPVRGSPEDFGRPIREDYERMGKLVKLAGIKPE